MKKSAIFIHMGQGVYRLGDRSEQSMFTLFMFLGDGLGIGDYIDFLLDEDCLVFQGNVSEVEKKGNIIFISIDDTIIPNLDHFITTINNLVMILREYKRLKSLEVDRIKIVLEDDALTITCE